MASKPRIPKSLTEQDVVYQDGVLLCVDKPAGILVHGDGTGARTLTDLARIYLEEQGRDARDLQALQRLDVETSGLVLFSLDKETQPALDAQVAGHDMRKRYLAVVSGSPSFAEKVIEAPIARDRHDARRMRAGAAGQGKPAKTLFKVVGRAAGRTLLEVELVTGRRHQIRVHLASIGFPIVGDELYGGARPKPALGERGLLLHALSEEVTHPVTGERLRLETPWPARLGAAWRP